MEENQIIKTGLELPLTVAKKHFLWILFHILWAYFILKGRINLKKVICYLDYVCLDRFYYKTESMYTSSLAYKISRCQLSSQLETEILSSTYVSSRQKIIILEKEKERDGGESSVLC